MSKDRYKRIGIIALKSLILIFLTAGISSLARYFLVYNMFGADYLSERALNVLNMVFFLLIFNSLVLTLNRHDKYAREKFFERSECNGLLPNVKAVVTSADLYVEIICITVLSLILPISLLYGFVSKIFLVRK